MATARPLPQPPPLRVIPGGLDELGGRGDGRDASRLRMVHGEPGGPGGPGRPGGSRRRFGRAAGPLTGYCAAAAGTAVAVAAGGTRHPVVAVAVLALALLAAATRMTLPAALTSGGIGWLFYDGFIIGRHANLGWDGVREVWWLLILMAAAGCGYALGRLFAHAGHGP